MATHTFEEHAGRSHHVARGVALLLLAAAVSFAAGRASRGVQEARGATSAPPAGGAPPPGAAAPEPPWKTHGFRDGETAADTCTDPACNG